jgi:hypothetical protein
MYWGINTNKGIGATQDTGPSNCVIMTSSLDITAEKTFQNCIGSLLSLFSTHTNTSRITDLNTTTYIQSSTAPFYLFFTLPIIFIVFLASHYGISS